VKKLLLIALTIWSSISLANHDTIPTELMEGKTFSYPRECYVEKNGHVTNDPERAYLIGICVIGHKIGDKTITILIREHDGSAVRIIELLDNIQTIVWDASWVSL